jgi:hypothetical protein
MSSEAGTAAPRILHLTSRSAHYLVNEEIVSEIQPASGRLRGFSFHHGLLEPRTALRNGPCGTTSNISGNGSPWIVYFSKPSGRRGDQQIIAVGVDRMETSVPMPPVRRRISEHGYEIVSNRRSDWKPTQTPEPTGAPQILCDQFFAPKVQRRPWSGGTMLCDPNPRTIIDPKTLSHECYIELVMHGTTWMTEFYLREGEQPDDQVRYARRFIDSINLPDDANTSGPFSPRDPQRPDKSMNKHPL